MKRPLGITVLVAFAIAIPLVIHDRATAVLRTGNAVLREQSQQLNQLLAENERLSKAAPSENLRPLSEAEHGELLKLRQEAAQLKRSLKDMDRLRREIDRITEAVRDQEHKKGDHYNPLKLLSEELPLRRARAARLKAWLAETPEQSIPEMQFLTERDWIDHAEWERVTDDEISGAIAAMRGNAESRFRPMAYDALKKYLAANEGNFPMDVAQLQPFFESPVDETILQRYMTVPAKSLAFLDNDWTGGDWVITQRAPINEKWDSRMAIGATSYMATVQEGRWTPRTGVSTSETVAQD